MGKKLLRCHSAHGASNDAKMRAARVDENQSAIVAALRKAGASVFVTSRVGGGFPDLVAGFGGTTYLLEVKNPLKPKADRQLTPEQATFFCFWRGHVELIETVDQALQVVIGNSILL